MRRDQASIQVYEASGLVRESRSPRLEVLCPLNWDDLIFPDVCPAAFGAFPDHHLASDFLVRGVQPPNLDRRLSGIFVPSLPVGIQLNDILGQLQE